MEENVLEGLQRAKPLLLYRQLFTSLLILPQPRTTKFAVPKFSLALGTGRKKQQLGMTDTLKR